jgi:hypothetical protein
MNHRSLAFRLGAWYTLLLSVTFVLVGTGTYYGLRQYLHSNMRDSLRRRSTEVEQILLQSPADISDSAIAQEIKLRLAPQVNNRFVRLTRVPGKLILLSGPPSDGSFNSVAVAARVVPEVVQG